MRKYLIIGLLFFVIKINAQTNSSATWEDFYSYNQVKDFVQNGDIIYALTDNAIFTYVKSTNISKKISSVNGLTGESTSAITYSSELNKLIVGYESGIFEIISTDGTIKKIVDIFISDVSSSKKINAMYEYNNLLYLSTPFGISVFNLTKLEFVDTYFIGENASSVPINNIVILDNIIYAASDNGVYSANMNSNLADFNNWDLDFSGVFNHLKVFNGEVLVASGTKIYKITNRTVLDLKITVAANVIDLNSYGSNIIVSTSKQAFVYNTSFILERSTNSSTHTITSAIVDGTNFWLGTTTLGILKSTYTAPNTFQEIHPQGPVNNSVFSISVKNNHLWAVYGGYSVNYTPIATALGVTHYNGSEWVYIPYNSFNATGLVHVTIDPNNINKVYISSWAQTNGTPSNKTGGVLVIENNAFSAFWNQTNSGLDEVFPDIPSYVSIRVDGSAFDSEGNFWTTSSLAPASILKKRSAAGVWSDHNLTTAGLTTDMNQLIVDKRNNIWVGSRRLGLFAYSIATGKNANLTVDAGGLPSLNVRTVAADRNNNIWIGTSEGLLRFDDADKIFDSSSLKANPITIVENGNAAYLLGTSTINAILVDGADNKWIGTLDGGVIQTNSTGRKTLQSFNKDNSPLPSNNILKIQIDESTGKVYFLTDKGIVAFKSGLAAYGDELTQVYGYPNPSLKHHSTVTITGKEGATLPYGTNVKILDVAGNLVYESNVLEDQSIYGGKIVWDKTNLSGAKVASGVYVVLLFNESGTQTSTTKIAVIN